MTLTRQVRTEKTPHHPRHHQQTTTKQATNNSLICWRNTSVPSYYSMIIRLANSSSHTHTSILLSHRPTGHRRERPRNGRVQNRKQATAEKKKVGDHNRGILLYYLPNTPRTHTVVYPPVTPTLRNSSLQTSTRSFLNRSNSWYKLAPDNLYFLSQIA